MQIVSTISSCLPCHTPARHAKKLMKRRPVITLLLVTVKTIEEHLPPGELVSSLHSSLHVPETRLTTARMFNLAKVSTLPAGT
jgi:hypothetical protein